MKLYCLTPQTILFGSRNNIVPGTFCLFFENEMYSFLKSKAFSGRFVAENEAVNGLCKILAHSETGRVLGVHLLGNGASEIINTAALAIGQQLTVDQWKQSVFAHPTVSEILKETLYVAE